MAPPKSSSFSVRVVLPASGWEMIANVRRRLISVEISSIAISGKGAQRLPGGGWRHCTACIRMFSGVRGRYDCGGRAGRASGLPNHHNRTRRGGRDGKKKTKKKEKNKKKKKKKKKKKQTKKLLVCLFFGCLASLSLAGPCWEYAAV